MDIDFTRYPLLQSVIETRGFISGVLRPGLLYFSTLYFCTSVTDFQSALKVSSTFRNSCGFVDDHALQ